MNTWIFQSNPSKFDLLANWGDGDIDDWTANQMRREMKNDDLVYFRISGPKAGLYGQGKLLSECFPSATEKGTWRVEVRYDSLIEPPLLRAETDAHPALKDYRPLKGLLATNFLVPPDIADELFALLSSRSTTTTKTTTIQSPWTAVNRNHIEAALTEWHEIGREKFLKLHNVNAAQKFVIVHEGHTYDAKAILIRAIRLVSGLEETQSTSFDGNLNTVAKPLRKLGFVVKDKDALEQRFWWVNQEETSEGFEIGFVWAPFTDKGHDGLHDEELASEIEPGDKVISYCHGKVQGFGLVTEDPVVAPTPSYLVGTKKAEQGWIVDVDFVPFANPFSTIDHISQFKDLLPQKHSPITPDGNIVDLDLAEISETFFTAIQKIGMKNTSTTPPKGTKQKGKPTFLNSSLDDEHEKELLQRTDYTGALEKEMVVKARRGQGIFRRNVRVVEKSCRVTGISQVRHLRASHIKPWRDSNDKEKIDGFNGLLLAPHVDHLFDAGWITFADDGKMICSPQLKDSILEAWNITKNLEVGSFTKEQRGYLKYHRETVFKNETS